VYRNGSKEIYLCYFIGTNESFTGFDDNNIEEIKDFAINNKFKIYNLSSNTDSKKEQQTIEEIKKENNETIVFITNNKNLFTNFNRPIRLIKPTWSIIEISNDTNYYINTTFRDIIEFLGNINVKDLTSIIKKMLFIYGDVFEINIKLLIKETSYLADNKKELINLLYEDLNMLEYKHILTSRLSIITYRLLFFDLEAKSTAIGNFYRKELNIKSKSYKFNNLNNNHDSFYFTDLVNKTFRGYQLLKIEERPKIKIRIPDFFDEKIKIAKNLLRNKVKIEVVSDSIGIPIDTLEEIIYNSKIISDSKKVHNINPASAASNLRYK
jgi:hypothetical protein